MLATAGLSGIIGDYRNIMINIGASDDGENFESQADADKFLEAARGQHLLKVRLELAQGNLRLAAAYAGVSENAEYEFDARSVILPVSDAGGTAATEVISVADLYGPYMPLTGLYYAVLNRGIRIKNPVMDASPNQINIRINELVAGITSSTSLEVENNEMLTLAGDIAIAVFMRKLRDRDRHQVCCRLVDLINASSAVHSAINRPHSGRGLSAVRDYSLEPF